MCFIKFFLISVSSCFYASSNDLLLYGDDFIFSPFNILDFYNLSGLILLINLFSFRRLLILSCSNWFLILCLWSIAYATQGYNWWFETLFSIFLEILLFFLNSNLLRQLLSVSCLLLSSAFMLRFLFMVPSFSGLIGFLLKFNGENLITFPSPGLFLLLFVGYGVDIILLNNPGFNAFGWFVFIKGKVCLFPAKW